jgi:protein-tyrosine phosphatase
MTYYRRLPLEGLSNARDLGGFAFPGGTTKYGSFIRSEVPNEITKSDIEFLIQYGVCMSIDFRGDVELERLPNLLSKEAAIDFRHIPTFNSQVARGAGISRDHPFVRWDELYIQMCDGNRDWVKNVFHAFAEARGAVMFNCTTGKDRTGIMTALLLGLAGVSHEDIIADYCVSEVYMRSRYLKLFNAMPPLMVSDSEKPDENLNDPFFRTSPDNMRRLLDHIDKAYGGIRSYLVSCGIDNDILDRVCHMLTE